MVSEPGRSAWRKIDSEEPPLLRDALPRLYRALALTGAQMPASPRRPGLLGIIRGTVERGAADPVPGRGTPGRVSHGGPVPATRGHEKARWPALCELPGCAT